MNGGNIDFFYDVIIIIVYLIGTIVIGVFSRGRQQSAEDYFIGEQNTYDTVAPIFNGKEDIIYVESRQKRKDDHTRLLAWWCGVTKDPNFLSSSHVIAFA